MANPGAYAPGSPLRRTAVRKRGLSRKSCKSGCFGLACRPQSDNFSWSGAGPNANWSTGANWIGGVAPTGSAASLDDLVFPAISKAQTPVNDFGGATFDSITIAGNNYNLSGNPLKLGTASVTG